MLLKKGRSLDAKAASPLTDTLDLKTEEATILEHSERQQGTLESDIKEENGTEAELAKMTREEKGGTEDELAKMTLSSVSQTTVPDDSCVQFVT